MPKKIITLCVAMSCIIGTIPVHAVMCKPRHVPVTRISGVHLEVSYISLFLLSAGVRYVKPDNLELWLKELDNVMKGAPRDVHKIILDYAGVSLADRQKRLYNKENRNAAVLFDEYIGKWTNIGRPTIDAEKFQQAIQFEQKSKDSASHLLDKIVRSMSNLGNDYEPNPFEYVIGKKSQGAACLVCGETVPCDIVSRTCDSIYRFSQPSLNLAFHKGDTSITITELLKRVMAIPQDAEQECACKSAVVVMTHDIFIKTPYLLLLQFDDKPSQKVVIPEFIEAPGNASTRYQLHAAWRERVSYSTTYTSVQFKSSDKKWYIPQMNAESVCHSPITWLGELASFNVSSSGTAERFSPHYNEARHYDPKFLLYKKVRGQDNTSSSCIIS